MKQILDLLPILLFFIAYKVYDIFVATAVAIAASVVLIAWLKLRARKVDTMQWVGLGIIVVFGGMTLLFQDETFIKWKPTVLYLAFAAVLLFARLFSGKNLISLVMGGQVALPAAQWAQLNWAWILFFTVMAALNIFVAYSFSTDTWVNFKLFGTTGMTLVFVLGQALWMSRYIQEDQAK